MHGTLRPVLLNDPVKKKSFSFLDAKEICTFKVIVLENSNVIVIPFKSSVSYVRSVPWKPRGTLKAPRGFSRSSLS